MNKDLDSRWEPKSESESNFCSDLPHFSVPRGFSLLSPLSFDRGVCIGWHVVASWTWDAQDKICGICRMAFDGYCPDCKLYGDDCPLRRSEEEALQATNIFSSALVGCVLRYLKFSNKAMGEKGVNAFRSLLRSQNTLEEPYLINVVGLNMYHNMREWHRDVINKVKQLNEIYALHTRRMPPRLMHYELSGGKLKHCASRRLVILVDETYATKTNAL